MDIDDVDAGEGDDDVAGGCGDGHGDSVNAATDYVTHVVTNDYACCL